MTVVQDGAPELWNLVAQLCERHDLAPTCELIDRFHVDERLAEVCELVTYDERTARELRESWRKYLDRSDTAMSRIVRRIDELLLHVLLGALDGDPPPRFWEPIARHRLSAERQQIISRHVEYFRNHRHLMRYASSLRCGYPIGSGPTEGACKSVVTMRFKRSGQRWLESGLAPCLALRARRAVRDERTVANAASALTPARPSAPSCDRTRSRSSGRHVALVPCGESQARPRSRSPGLHRRSACPCVPASSATAHGDAPQPSRPGSAAAVARRSPARR